MSTAFRLLEVTTLRSTLALQFLDPVLRTAVSDGVAAKAWPVDDPSAATAARPSPVSATLGFANLPGLLAYETGLSPAAPSLPGPLRQFVVRTVDGLSRFLPTVQVIPVPQPAVVTTVLFSAPTRPAHPGFAAIRGEVWTRAGRPTGWAVVTLSQGATMVQALTDAQGRFACYPPYPDALPALPGSLPAGGSIDNLTWPLFVTVQCRPSVLVRPSGTGTADPPDLASILAQGDATIEDAGILVPSVSRVLRFGQPLAVASSGSTRLIVEPA
jgi:hypothetical protein